VTAIVEKSSAREFKFDPHDLANEELRHVYRGRNNALLVTALTGAIAAGLLGWGINALAGIAWYLWLLAATGWHWLMGRSTISNSSIGLRLSGINHHIAAASLAGAGWGSAAITLPWLDRSTQDAMLIIMLIAVNTALPRLVVFLPVFFAFAAGVYVPLVLMLPFLENDSRRLVAMVLVIVGITLWFSAKEIRRVLVETLLKQISFERASWEDRLTGLGNRRHFDEKLDSGWRQAARLQVPLSLIILDVDHFKKFNDNYGHPAGDECLRQVATALDNCARRANDSVARYGGEEFAVVLFHTPMNDAKNMSEKLRTAVLDLKLQHEFSAHGVVTISVGGATIIPSPDAKVEDLIKLADEALYRAKELGRNRIEWAVVS